MKIGFISDLHVDMNPGIDVIALTAQAAADRGVKVLIVAGDFDETPVHSIEAVDRLAALCRERNIEMYFVPGNHDLWNKNCPEMGIDEIEAMFRNHPNCLMGKTVTLHADQGDLALVGDVGWYDYSFAEAGFSEEELYEMTAEGRVWHDHWYNPWTKDNRGQTRRRLALLEEAMKEAGDLPIIAVTHMLPVKAFTVPPKGMWRLFNGYLGTPALQALYLKYPVRIAVCGHVHYRSSVFVDNIRHICPCLGYAAEWPLYHLKDNAPMTHILDSLQVLDL